MEGLGDKVHVVMNRVGAGSGGRNLILAAIMAFVGFRACQATFKLASTDNTVPSACANNAQNNNAQNRVYYYGCAERIPVFSTGVSFRMNVLGYLVLETYIAHPLQRQFKQWVVGIQAAPGW